jgi:hypothetical protein
MKQMMKWLSVPVLTAVLLLGVQSPAHAQNNIDVSAGYQFGHVSQNGFSTTLPYGWNVDVSGAIRPMWAWVGEVGGIYKSENGVTDREHSYQGGVRVFEAVTPMFTPYGQVLLGGLTSSASCSGCSSASAFSVQPGGGVDIKVSPKASARIAADYRRVFFSDTNGGGRNDFRMVFGVVFHTGK